MKNIFIITLVFAAAFILCGAGEPAREGCYNEDACYKSYVTDKDKDIVLAINRDTEKVELYWSETLAKWIKPTEDQLVMLQKMYNKKAQLKEMQSNLDNMRRRDWYETTQNSGLSGGGRR